MKNVFFTYWIKKSLKKKPETWRGKVADQTVRNIINKYLDNSYNVGNKE